MFKKVLAATARPLECDESVASANLIAQFNNANLLILYVLESNTSIYRNYVRHYRSGEEIVSNEVYQDQVIEKVYTKYSDDFKPPDKFEFHIAFGVPWMEILKTAREESVDLIILSAHAGKASSEERQRIGGTLGSTAESVIKHERRPVMIVNKTIPQSKVLFEKIMVSIDFSPSCISAFKFAVELAQKRESKLYLFHMLPVPPQPEY
ncbi:MAG: universal stress protein, partial [Desulfobacterales bacterium]